MHRVLDKGRNGLDRLAHLYESICVILLIAMLVINALNIVTRGVFDSSLNWVWPWTMVAFLTWVMLAFFPLYQRRKDVSIYILLQFLPSVAQRALGVLVAVSIMIASGLLIYTFPERLASLRGTIEMVGLPRKILIWPLLASALPIFLGALLDAIRILSGAAYVPFGMIEVTEATK
ncbi:TRAP transporter small permease subunit [Halomonas alkaliantarctica]|uniref:TRAP transporter small permease protein n=1 Tax=Halomonas alkaliantarctica TaxID=232346 RepID=A0ABY8LKD3_9GAMM|nr:TRAP transporter small permease subunit [Halomonas alkaliantarctica]WGI24815.1 TRAP transporter small permease subunit [Halomonas alkaliantarctica]